MAVPLEFLRGVLGLLCVSFGHMAGRSAVRVRKGEQRVSKLYGWIIRATITALAVAWRHGLDGVTVMVLAAAVVSAAAGAWIESRPRKPEEDLSKELFRE